LLEDHNRVAVAPANILTLLMNRLSVLHLLQSTIKNQQAQAALAFAIDRV